MHDDGGWRRCGTRHLFESRWFNLRQDDVLLPTGEAITYTFVEHPGYAMVVPLLDDGRVILERIYRYTVRETVLECPSGGLDGEAPELAARRELQEETGWSADRMDPLGSFFGSNGISDERFHLFLATGLRPAGRPAREPTEQIEIVEMPLAEATELALDGRLRDAPSALALILALRHLRRAPAVTARARADAVPDGSTDPALTASAQYRRQGGDDMTTNKDTVARYLDGFRETDHAKILSCLTDDVEWDMPGYFRLAGKEAFDRAIENDAFEGSPTITLRRMIEEDGVVVAEGAVRSRRRDGGRLDAVFCDVFEMRDGKIARLTTYQSDATYPDGP